MADPIITKIETHTYEYETENLGKDYNGFNTVYEPGNRMKSQGNVLRIETDQGIVGEYAGGGGAEFSTIPTFAHFLIGRSALQRELIYTEVRRALRQVARIGYAPIDIALWDIAGKLYDQPIYKLLGGYKSSIPCYASTYHGDHQPDGLSSPEAFADFAEQCLELGYPAFKIHGWGRAPVSQEVANVHAVGKRVGDKMDLMLDPACEADDLRRCRQSRLGLRRKSLLLVRRPLPRRRHLPVRPPQAAPVDQYPNPADRACSFA